MAESPTAADPSETPAALRWAQNFLPHYFSDPPCHFHAEMFATLADPKQRLIARAAPRGHAKSTCAALAYPLWCLCQRRRRHIVIVTQETALAAQFVRDIRAELESNERILAEYGDLCRDAVGAERAGTPARRTRRKWADTHFTTTTGITVQAKGAGAGFRGMRSGPHRPDLIICDDLEKDEHVRSAKMRKKLENWLRRVVLPALAPRGQVVVLGSLIHHDSLLANLRDPQRAGHWNYAVYRAIEAAPGPDGEYRRVALWPARWPLERLDEERARIGAIAFEHEYQANPIDESIRAFRPEWLQRYAADELVPERLVNLMAVDPATGKTGGDYFALWVGSVDTADGVIYTRRLTLERIRVGEQVRRIIAAFEQWRPVKIGIETNAYQVALKDFLDEEGRRCGLYLPIVELPATRNKQARIEGTTPLYENGTFRLPPALPSEVEEQFLHFPEAGHDDAPDVCAMGVELARSLRRGSRIEGAVAARNPFARHGAW